MKTLSISASKSIKSLALAACFLCGAVMSAPALATTIFWTDWRQVLPSAGGATVLGVITTSTSSVAVTYNNPQGIAFAQVNGGTDYYTNQNGVRDPDRSPYTSPDVSNIPTGTDIIGLQFAGVQTLTFSTPVANPVLAFVSLNSNSLLFSENFYILSSGDPIEGKDCGYWGCGILLAQTVGSEFELTGIGEPHGVILFLGVYSSISWRSTNDEFWNGFTVGVQGTAAEVYPPNPLPNRVPVPTTMMLLALGLPLVRRSGLIKR